MFIFNCFKHSAKSCNCSQPRLIVEAPLRAVRPGWQHTWLQWGCAFTGFARHGITSPAPLAASSKRYVHIWVSIFCTEMPEEASPAFTTPRCISWSVSFPAGGLELRAEGHYSCSGFCQTCRLCFFCLGPKHILGDSPTITMVCCPPTPLSHKLFAISKAGTSLMKWLVLGFLSGIYRTQNRKHASYKQNQKRRERPSPRAHHVSAHCSGISRLKPSWASVFHPT